MAETSAAGERETDLLRHYAALAWLADDLESRPTAGKRQR